MKLLSLFILTACLSAAATGNSQSVTLNVKEAPLEKVFTEIRKQTGFNFLFSSKEIKEAGKVTLQVSNASIGEVLNLCFKNKPFEYSIENNTIVVKSKPITTVPVIASDEGAKQSIDIKGRVTNENGDAVAATVTVKGTSNATATDANGNFNLKAVDENATLIITGVSIESVEVKVGNKTDFVIIAKTKVSPLDEIQIQAYGTTSKRLTTSNITTVKGEDIAKQPVTNPLLALQGRVPGLFISQTTGLPGGAVKVRLQGQNSILNGNDPLYVVDGVPFAMQLLTTTIGGPLTGSGVGAGGFPLVGNPLNYIDPNQIESIEVLKDADATAIYGSRAANGAILITTKKGKPGKVTATVNVQKGWGQVPKEVSMLNTQQYLALRREAYRNENATPTSTQYDINGFWDTTRYTNWQKELIGNTAQYSQVITSLSGGNSSLRYNTSGSFSKNGTVFPNFPTKFKDEKASFHINLQNESDSKRFSFQFTGNYLVEKNLLPQTDPTLRAFNLVPTAPALFKADGSLNWMPNSSGSSTWYNPLADLYNTYENRASNLITNIILKYKLTNSLELSSSFGYTNLQIKEFIGNPMISFKPEQYIFRVRSANYTNSEIKSWIVEPQLSFKRKLGIGRLEALAGMTFQKNNSEGQGIYADGFSDDALLRNILSAATVSPFKTEMAEYKYNAAFGRINYNISDRYLINLNARRDGSTRFGPENRFHNFGSVGLGWIFSSESFFNRARNIFSFGKLRASYGTTGSDQIGDYGYYNLYTSIGGVSVPYQGIGGITINGIFNPYLQWEETKKLQFGIDLGLFNDRILLTGNYVRNRSSNQLLGYSLPITTGFYGVNRNFPATVQNTSIELSLTSVNVRGKNFTWETKANITIPQNKLIAFPNLETSSYSNSLIIGESITIQKVFHEIGVNSQTGRYQFLDSKGNPTYTPSFEDDKIAIIDRTPKFYGGIENSLSYKKLRLDFLFQFVKQSGREFLTNSIPGRYLAGSINGYNQPITVLDRWQKPGDISTIQRAVFDLRYASEHNYHEGSDAVWGDASFIRLKNLSLNWQLPDLFLEKLHVSELSFFVQGQNLLTITKYQGLDPESQSTTSLPPLRVVMAGINVKF